jgi:hypothetical protein
MKTGGAARSGTHGLKCARKYIPHKEIVNSEVWSQSALFLQCQSGFQR